MLDFLLIIAAALEFWGAVLMANQYLAVNGWKQVVIVLASSLYPGAEAKRAATWSEIISERPLSSIRGFALISAGFGIQLFCVLIEFFVKIVPSAPT